MPSVWTRRLPLLYNCTRFAAYVTGADSQDEATWLLNFYKVFLQSSTHGVAAEALVNLTKLEGRFGGSHNIQSESRMRRWCGMWLECLLEPPLVKTWEIEGGKHRGCGLHKPLLFLRKWTSA